MTDAMAHDTGPHASGPRSTRVYLDYYRLVEAPFAITPDPEFLFSSGPLRQVLDKIHYAIEGRMGFVLLTGEVGTGKTTLCRTLLDRFGEAADTVYVINPSVTGHELLAGILDDLGEAVPPAATKKELIDRLNHRLLENGVQRPMVVIIDDAQTMPPGTLEDLRLLSNLETDKHKLIQVILSGQPELSGILAGSNLRQLRQRIAIHCRLAPLSADETGAYVARRLFVAGNQGQVQFSRSAIRLIHRRTGGIPRLVNKLCDFALTAGYVADASSIETAHVREAWREMNTAHHPFAAKRIRGLLFSGSGFVVAALALLLFFAPVTGIRSPVASPPGDFVERPETVSLAMGTAAAQPEPLDSPGDTAATKPAASATRADTNRVDPAPLKTPEGPKPVEPHVAPQEERPDAAVYALQLGSYRSETTARRGAAHFQGKGISAHWQRLNGGQWYRVIAGRFPTMATANQYKKAHKLASAMVIKAPFTVKVLPRRPDVPGSNLPALLSEIGYDARRETSAAGETDVYTGLFNSVADASLIAERINEAGHLLAQVVAR